MQHDALKPSPSSSAPPATPASGAAWATTPYVAVWGILAIIAVAYISVAVARPDILGARSGATTSAGQDNRIGRTKSGKSDNLADKLARMEKDLQSTQANDAKRVAEKKSHLDRIAALEAKAAKAEAEVNTSAPSTDPIQTPAVISASSKQAADEIAERLGGAKILNGPEAKKKSTTLVKQTAKDAPEKTVAEVTKSAIKAAPTATAKTAPKKVAALAKPKPAPKPIAKAPAKITTGSIGRAATKPITFGPAVVTRATRPIGVRIATGPSVDSLRLSWNALADRHGASLKRLQPRYVTGIDATGLTYDLIAGPFNTANEASQVCARLHANGARCALGEFTGNAL